MELKKCGDCKNFLSCYKLLNTKGEDSDSPTLDDVSKNTACDFFDNKI